MPRILALFWDDDDRNINHLWDSHRVRPEEIEEIIYGVDDEPSNYLILRDGQHYVIFGKTGNGRLLEIVGDLERGMFRPFGARDMDEKKQRKYRSRGK